MINRIAVAALAASCLCPPLAAQEGARVWSSLASDEGVAILYALPESDDVAFHVYCSAFEKTITLTVTEEVPGMAVGRPLTITLAAGGKTLGLKGSTTTDEMNGFVYGMAEKVAKAPLVEVLSAPGPLTITMGRTRVVYPEKDRAKAAAHFGEGCELT